MLQKFVINNYNVNRMPSGNPLQISQSSSKAPSQPHHILRFWRDLEMFTIPNAPTSKDATDQIKIITMREGDVLPWLRAEFQATDKHTYLHTIYVGVADTEGLASMMLKVMFPDQDLNERERERLTGTGFLASFSVDDHGNVSSDSYFVSSFVHALAALKYNEPLDHLSTRLDNAKQEFAQRSHKVSEATNSATAHQTMTWDDLSHELDIVKKLLDEPTVEPNMRWRYIVKTKRISLPLKKDEDYADSNDPLNSFYLADLDRLIKLADQNQPFGEALTRYLGTPIPQTHRIDILKDHSTMGQLVSVARLPSSRWPAPANQPLVLAQQAAVAQVKHLLGHNNGILGINGPPGTGKTTLLCDVITDVITERARRIANLSFAQDIFEKETTTIAAKRFYPLKPELVRDTSIVVSSNNNNAVKNISQELPALAKLGDKYKNTDYFQDVMQQVFLNQKVFDENNQPIASWGVIAAALGNMSNRKSFAAGFYGDMPQRHKKPAVTGGGQDNENQNQNPTPSLSQILTDASESRPYRQYQEQWQSAKQLLLNLFVEFEAKRAVLYQAELSSLLIGECETKLQLQREVVTQLEQPISQLTTSIQAHKNTITMQQTLINAHQAALDQMKANHLPNLWDKLMAWLGLVTAHLASIRQLLATPTLNLVQATERYMAETQALQLAEAATHRLQDQLKSQEHQHSQLNQEYQRHQQTLQAGYATGTKHFIGEAFWSKSFADCHRASIAVNPELDDLRARIFLQSVELHRLTILANAHKFLTNLKSVNAMLTGVGRGNILLEQRPSLWDSFFFMVPVVSTTLASFDRLFAGMNQDSIGWLLIDEAGQATPQSAVGAIWRSRRAILIGDPLQIEPVITTPFSIVNELRHRHHVDEMWSPSFESVQTLADRITRHGSWVKQDNSTSEDAEKIWTGMPLRTHRRCDDPMFSIANDIAYAGQMVQGRVDPNGNPEPSQTICALGPSTWFDVQSNQTSHPVVKEEIELLIELIHSLQNPIDDSPPFTAKIFVISPFRKVMQACRDQIKQEKLANVECGTVHTFQGKEAEIVFLVLGTAAGRVGAGARTWASAKPNLLNVAITRAKHRLFVIGNLNEWRKQNYFSNLCETLPIKMQSDKVNLVS